MPLPKTQTAACIDVPGPDATLDIRHDVPVPEPQEGEILVKLEYMGFCHSDVHNIKGELPMSTNIPGHEGVGRVVQDGYGAHERGALRARRPVGTQTVRIKVIQGGYFPAYAIRVLSNIAAETSRADPTNQLRTEYIVSPAEWASPIPETLKPEAVAPLLCASLIMYAALKKLDKFCEKGNWVVLMGAGGGLGHLGIKSEKRWATGSSPSIAQRPSLTITPTSKSKREICIKSGASAFIDFKDDAEKRIKELTGDGFRAHAVVVVAGVERAYEQGVTLLRPTGTVVCVGLPRIDYHIPISPVDCVNRGYQVIGSAVGTEEEMQALLKLAEEGKVSTHYEVFDFDKVNDVMAKLVKYEVNGRAVLRIPE